MQESPSPLCKRSLSCSQACGGHPKRRTAYVSQTKTMAKLHTTGLTPVLTTYPQFDILSRLAHFTASHSLFFEGGLREGKTGDGDTEW